MVTQVVTRSEMPMYHIHAQDDQVGMVYHHSRYNLLTSQLYDISPVSNTFSPFFLPVHHFAVFVSLIDSALLQTVSVLLCAWWLCSIAHPIAKIAENLRTILVYSNGSIHRMSCYLMVDSMLFRAVDKDAACRTIYNVVPGHNIYIVGRSSELVRTFPKINY